MQVPFRIKILDWKDGFAKTFAITREFPRPEGIYFVCSEEPLGIKSLSEVEEEPTDEFVRLIKALTEIPGIERINLGCREVKIVIAKAYDWEEDGIESKIIKTLEQFFGEKAQVVRSHKLAG